jgi:hypothetical protein
LLKDDLAEVAKDLIDTFGGKGFFLAKGDTAYDPFMGTQTGDRELIPVKYVIKHYTAKELVEGKILSGDAVIKVYIEPKEDWLFRDAYDDEWTIVNGGIVPNELQSGVIDDIPCDTWQSYFAKNCDIGDGKVAFSVHIRK